VVEDLTKQQLLKAIPHVESGYPLGSHQALGIGGPARYYTVATDTVELVQAVKAACDAGIPYRVLGMAESTIVGDGGFEGLIIQNNSQSYAASQEQSQVVVDSGMSMRRLITILANMELGGLIPLFGAGGSVGGALFNNTFHARGSNQRFADSLRSLTLLMPPTKIKPEPSIVRFKGTWLTTRVDEGETKLIQAASKDAGRMPVVLTAQIQLTSLRTDEIVRRMQQESLSVSANEPQGEEALTHFGPLFSPILNAELEEAFQVAGIGRLEVGGLVMSKRYPNYVMLARRSAKKSALPVSSKRLLAFTSAVQAKVAATFGAKLELAFACIGETDDAVSPNF
jgi:UDP-N-acetylenolpyruvoylglucosamine reductase